MTRRRSCEAHLWEDGNRQVLGCPKCCSSVKEGSKDGT